MSFFSTCFLFFFTLLLNQSWALANGEADDGRHPWTGYLGIPDTNLAVASGCTSPAAYYSCGGSLVNVPGLPTRRVFLTAAHCVNHRLSTDTPLLIHFMDSDEREIENCTVAKRVVGLSAPAPLVFKGWYSWSGDVTTPENGGGNGQYKADYALVLLDRPVPFSLVPTPPLIYGTYANQREDVTQRSLSVLGMAGYGIVGYGSRADNSLGQPIAFSGPREKQYVEMPINSISNFMMVTSMVAAQDDPSACSGDSGSAAMNIWNSTIYGVTSSGDMWCRATNTFSRVGTAEFWNWINSVKSDIVAKSYVERLE